MRYSVLGTWSSVKDNPTPMELLVNDCFNCYNNRTPMVFLIYMIGLSIFALFQGHRPWIIVDKLISGKN